MTAGGMRVQETTPERRPRRAVRVGLLWTSYAPLGNITSAMRPRTAGEPRSCPRRRRPDASCRAASARAAGVWSKPIVSDQERRGVKLRGRVSSRPAGCNWAPASRRRAHHRLSSPGRAHHGAVLEASFILGVAPGSAREPSVRPRSGSSGPAGEEAVLRPGVRGPDHRSTPMGGSYGTTGDRLPAPPAGGRSSGSPLTARGCWRWRVARAMAGCRCSSRIRPNTSAVWAPCGRPRTHAARDPDAIVQALELNLMVASTERDARELLNHGLRGSRRSTRRRAGGVPPVASTPSATRSAATARSCPSGSSRALVEEAIRTVPR